MAPLILPLNHINSNYLMEILMSKYRHTPTNKDGTNTPRARANTQEKSTAKRKTKLNFCYCIPYIPSPRYVNTKASAACPIVSMASVLLILLF